MIDLKTLYPNITSTLSIGNDLIHLPTFTESFSPAFQRKVYTENELNYCNSFSLPMLRLASTFAAKEAVFKALKQQDKKLVIPWRKIEILRDKPAGIPTVVLHIEENNWNINLSLTHDGNYIWAVVLISKSVELENPIKNKKVQ